MANTQSLRRRIRSVGNTKQITKAMELVAAAKMRRVQGAVERVRIYADAAAAIVSRLAKSPDAKSHPYFSPPNTKAKLYILITSDSGLAGAYNTNVLNLAHKAFAEDHSSGFRPLVVAIGRKGAHHISHLSDVELVADYEKFEDDPDTNVFAPIIETIADGIANADFSSVHLLYTEFRSSLNHQPRDLQLIPVIATEPVETDSAEPHIVFEFEPDAEAVLEESLRLYLESALRRARVEAAAAEHAMRMLSMNNANRNAGNLIDNLTLELNATRQAAITQEMAEIIGGADAIA